MTDKKPSVHGDTITIRVNPKLKRRAAEAAYRQGMTLSEAIRQFLRELAKQAD